jgi:hypothetical protein
VCPGRGAPRGRAASGPILIIFARSCCAADAGPPQLPRGATVAPQHPASLSIFLLRSHERAVARLPADIFYICPRVRCSCPDRGFASLARDRRFACRCRGIGRERRRPNRHANRHQASQWVLAGAGVRSRLRWRWLVTTPDQIRNQRADQERSHVILPGEVEFRPQFLLRENVRADHTSDAQSVKRALSSGSFPGEAPPWLMSARTTGCSVAHVRP